MTSDSTAEAYLFFRIGSRACAIPLAHVAETMRPLRIEPLAGTPACVLGVAIIRGAATPVIDTGRIVGVAGLHPTRFVTVKTGERTAALAVDAVLGVRALPDAALAGVPPLLREAGADSLAAISVLDAQLLLVLETARLVPQSVWDAIAGPGAAP